MLIFWLLSLAVEARIPKLNVSVCWGIRDCKENPTLGLPVRGTPNLGAGKGKDAGR